MINIGYVLLYVHITVCFEQQQKGFLTTSITKSHVCIRKVVHTLNTHKSNHGHDEYWCSLYSLLQQISCTKGSLWTLLSPQSELQLLNLVGQSFMVGSITTCACIFRHSTRMTNSITLSSTSLFLLNRHNSSDFRLGASKLKLIIMQSEQEVRKMALLLGYLSYLFTQL